MSDFPDWLEGLLCHHRAHDTHLAKILQCLERVIEMSGTFASDLTALTDAVNALTTEVSSGLAANDAAIQALKDQIAGGGAVSAADLGTLETNTAAIKAAVDAMHVRLNPVPPVV